MRRQETKQVTALGAYCLDLLLRSVNSLPTCKSNRDYLNRRPLLERVLTLGDDRLVGTDLVWELLPVNAELTSLPNRFKSGSTR